MDWPELEPEVQEAVESVMLEIAYSPVLVEPESDTPSPVVKIGDVYHVRRPLRPLQCSADELKVMRARFLIRRAWYAYHWFELSQYQRGVAEREFSVSEWMAQIIADEKDGLPNREEDHIIAGLREIIGALRRGELNVAFHPAPSRVTPHNLH
jgi:hypothetical protein